MSAFDAPDVSDAPKAVARLRLSPEQKAAVVVRVLVDGGAKLPLDSLSEAAQARLAAAMADLRFVDRDTLRATIDEFAEEIDQIGLSFPNGIEGALGLLDGHLSPATAARLRREAGIAAKGNPWERLAGLANEKLVGVLEEESVEVGAVLLSKLDVSRAAELLSELPGDLARRISYAISRTGKVEPETVQRIGLSLAEQLDNEPARAFEAAPVERVGAILNFSRAATRDAVLSGLEETDAGFAAEVRKAIFTFALIPKRVTPRDIPKITRGIEESVLVTALAFASAEAEAARDFFLDNLSKRIADGLREAIDEAGKIKDSDGEDAMNAVVAEIRRLEEIGELLFVAGDDED